MEPLEVYRSFSIYRDEKGFYYDRGPVGNRNRWYFISIEDAKTDIDIWLDY